MVLDCPCLALEAQLIQNLLNKPLTKFGSSSQLYATAWGLGFGVPEFRKAHPLLVNFFRPGSSVGHFLINVPFVIEMSLSRGPSRFKTLFIYTRYALPDQI